MNTNFCKSFLGGIFLSMLLFAACSERTSDSIDMLSQKDFYSISSDSSQVTILQENLYSLGQIKQIVGKTDTSFLVTDAKNVVEYSYKGYQIRRFGQIGNAKGEYISVGYLYATDAFVYVWCCSKMKLIKYDFLGNYIAEYPGPSCAIHKFAVCNDSVAAYYLVGRGEEILCEKRLNEKLSTEELSYGQVSNEDLMLYFSPTSGGLAYLDNRLFFSHASKLTLYEVLDKRISSTFKLDYQSFITHKVNESPRNSSGLYDIHSVVDYLYNNSVVTGVYPSSSDICVLAETGHIVPKDGQNDFSERHLNLLFVDLNNKTFTTFQQTYFDNYCCYTYAYPFLLSVVSDTQGNIKLIREKVNCF